MGSCVSVKFNREKIAKKSKLIPRLKKCANWNEIKKEFEKLESNKQSPISGFLSPELKAKAVDGRFAHTNWSDSQHLLLVYLRMLFTKGILSG